MLHLLLAEDNPGDVDLVQKALDEYCIPHTLLVVRDGGEALDYMARMGQNGDAPVPDILLLDLNLPKLNGPRVLEEFRRYPACAETPVIVVSSSNAPADRQSVAELGVVRYFRKPSDLKSFLQLGAVVRQIADSKK